MRFTNVLLKESYRWRFKTAWQRQSQYVESPLITPFRRGEGNVLRPHFRFIISFIHSFWRLT